MQATVRVELHGATEANYQQLHAAMERKGFSRQIRSDTGVVYQLPQAEYSYEGTKSRSEVLDLAAQAATATGRDFEVLVTESAGRTWKGLKKVRTTQTGSSSYLNV